MLFEDKLYRHLKVWFILDMTIFYGILLVVDYMVLKYNLGPLLILVPITLTYLFLFWYENYSVTSKALNLARELRNMRP